MNHPIIISLDHLQSTVRKFALEHSIDEIPRSYYEAIMETWHEMNLLNYNWDHRMAAAALIYAAVVDGFVHPSQMTPEGYRAFDSAEIYMHKLRRSTPLATPLAA